MYYNKRPNLFNESQKPSSTNLPFNIYPILNQTQSDINQSLRPIFCSTAIFSSSPLGMVTTLPRRRRDSISALIS